MSMLLLQCLGFADERVTEMTAALELMKRENRLLRQIASTRFRPNSRYLARRLLLSIDQINAALTQLLVKGSVRMESRGKWVINAAPR